MLTASMMDKGTKKRDAIKIREDIEKLGSSLGVGGGKTGAYASISCVKRNLDATFDILADVVLNPTFPKDELERERKQSIDRIAQQKSSPDAVASQVFSKMLFGATHPLGITPTEASVKNITVDDLKQNYTAFWVPNNAVMTFVGDITLDDATKLAERYFGSWKKGDVPNVQTPAFTAPSEHIVYLVDRQAAPQSQIRIGSTAPNRYTKDYYPLQVMNTLLGGGFATRLNLNLREDKGYTYGAYSGISYGRDYGSWTAAAGVQTKFTKESLVEFKKEITGIGGSKPVTDEEIGGVKKNLTRGFVQNFESAGMVLGQIAPLLSYELPVEEIDRFIPEVLKQTPQSVMETAKKYFDFDHSITVVVGDLSKIEEGIRALGWGKVVVVDEDGKVLR
jgi:zinc protease